eukprot:GEMP01014586.1.p1 GENE.GEMP01014586.1~~GEMP01014586.1.p1  ORF type:complete len:653 (+),score=206.36 GEMP01014586.1:127-2085(+)
MSALLRAVKRKEFARAKVLLAQNAPTTPRDFAERVYAYAKLKMDVRPLMPQLPLAEMRPRDLSMIVTSFSRPNARYASQVATVALTAHTQNIPSADLAAILAALVKLGVEDAALWARAQKEVTYIARNTMRQYGANAASKRGKAAETPAVGVHMGTRREENIEVARDGHFGLMVWSLAHVKMSVPINEAVLDGLDPRGVANLCWALTRIKPSTPLPWPAVVHSITRSLDAATDPVTISALATSCATLQIKDPTVRQALSHAVSRLASGSGMDAASSSSRKEEAGGETPGKASALLASVPHKVVWTGQVVANIAWAFAQMQLACPVPLVPLVQSVKDWTPVGLSRFSWAAAILQDTDAMRAALVIMPSTCPTGEDISIAALAAAYAQDDHMALQIAAMLSGLDDAAVRRLVMEDMVALVDADCALGGILSTSEPRLFAEFVGRIAHFFEQSVTQVVENAAQVAEDDHLQYQEDVRSLDVAHGGILGTSILLRALGLGGLVTTVPVRGQPVHAWIHDGARPHVQHEVSDTRNAAVQSSSPGMRHRGIGNQHEQPLIHVDRLGRPSSAGYRVRRSRCKELVLLNNLAVEGTALVDLRVTQMPCISCVGAFAQAKQRGMNLCVTIDPLGITSKTARYEPPCDGRATLGQTNSEVIP